MDPLRILVSLMLERAIEEKEIEEMSGSSATVGYTAPLGAKPPRILDPGAPSGRRKPKRRSAVRAVSSAFGDAKPSK